MKSNLHLAGPNDRARVELANFSNFPEDKAAAEAMLGRRRQFIDDRFWVFTHDAHSATARSVGSIIVNTMALFHDFDDAGTQTFDLKVVYPGSGEEHDASSLTLIGPVRFFARHSPPTDLVLAEVNSQLEALQSPFRLPLK